MIEIKEFLKHVEIFSSLNEKELEYVSHFLDIRNFVEGQIIFKEGDKGDSMYVISRGIINSKCKLPNGMDRDVAQFFPGDFFGEMAIFENASRSATCYSLEEGTVIVMNSSTIFKLMIHNSKIALKILHNILNIIVLRLKERSEFLSNIVHWGETARKRAITDELTGVYNRRFLEEELDLYFENAKTSGKNLSILMIDLDDFRTINDNYGHDTGDIVLMKIVEAFQDALDKKYILARYGGDEFFVILPETSLDESVKIAEQLRKRIENLHVMSKKDCSIFDLSASIGVATFPDDSTELKSLKEFADKALYRAKSEGKNKVVFS